jgi:asparagine synthase (glutamine-hydrolysing)
MCGIAGLLGVAPPLASEAALRMQASLRHRGPDDQGIEIVSRTPSETPAVLVHTRLSIVDLSTAGHQPMEDRPPAGRGGPNWVTFNGEIYNFRGLWPELEQAGWPCRSRSDTEVLLHAYRVWGLRAVERFEGMFAFCLLDTERGMAWLCRDRLGIKPLYTYRARDGGLLFASEVRALLASNLVSRTLRPGAVESFLAQGAVMADHSIVQGVECLAPGSSLVVDFEGKEVRRTRYWTIAFGREEGALTEPAHGSPALRATARGVERYRSEVVADLAFSLRRSVAQELLADVPVGLFLSSGVDSTALAVLAKSASPQPLSTLAIGFDVAELDESAAAGVTARELGTVHRRVGLSGADVLGSFDDVLAAMDQPTVDGFNVYFVARAARESGLTVALSGLGGDELFGGYRSFVDVPRALSLDQLLGRALRGPRSRALAANAVSAVGTGFGMRRPSRALMKLAATLNRPADVKELYFLRRELCSPEERRALHALPTGSEAWSGVDSSTFQALCQHHRDAGVVDQVACLEVESYMRHMLLRDADVFSMAHGIEVRVPLLGHRVVERAASARSAWRLPDPRPKPLLLDAVGAELPERVWRDKKRGFTFPWESWLRGPLKARVDQAVHDDRLRNAGLEPEAARIIWERFLAGDRSVSALELLGFTVLEAFVSRHGLGL